MTNSLNQSLDKIGKNSKVECEYLLNSAVLYASSLNISDFRQLVEQNKASKDVNQALRKCDE